MKNGRGRGEEGKSRCGERGRESEASAEEGMNEMCEGGAER